jgi:hypothetical protein
MSGVSTIVKVQRALFPRDAPALIYDQSRAHTVQAELSEDVRHQMGGEAKAYFRAVWTGKTFVLRERVANQPW